MLLINSAASLIRMVLEHEAIQREMARQARTDPLTGLLNRRAFLEELSRHVDRLDREEHARHADVRRPRLFQAGERRLGHEVGDQVLVHTANVLRNTVRPTDLVARLGGDEFASVVEWRRPHDRGRARRPPLHRGADLAGNARAATADQHQLGVSIGIATREPGQPEPMDSLLRRADLAMYEVKRSGRGNWRVAREANA